MIFNLCFCTELYQKSGASSTQEIFTAAALSIISFPYHNPYLIGISFFRLSVIFYKRPEGETKTGQRKCRKRVPNMLKEFYESFSHREGK
jgi:hypothetical protein